MELFLVILYNDVNHYHFFIKCYQLTIYQLLIKPLKF